MEAFQYRQEKKERFGGETGAQELTCYVRSFFLATPRYPAPVGQTHGRHGSALISLDFLLS